MSKTANISILERTDMSKGAKNDLKKQGYLLGNITGKGMESIAVAVKRDEMRRGLNTYGRNAVFNLTSDKQNTFTVMVKEIQTKPLVNEFSHIDFAQVSLSTEVKSDIAIALIGTDSLEAKKLIVNRQLDFIPVVGLPQDIPDALTIDVSKLEAGDSIKVGDIEYPKGITHHLSDDQVVITVSETKLHSAAEETEEDEEETE